VKVRIGVGTGAGGLDGEGLGDLADCLVEVGLDSLWLSEVLTGPGLDPLVGLAWAGAHNRRIKLGTTMLLPGRNPIRLAGQVGALDALSQGRFLVTFVPGLTIGAEREAVGVEPARRGAAMEEVLPLLRRLWAGERVSHTGSAGSFHDVAIETRPVQDPFDVWLGGSARRSLERCGRLADGWLPSMCTPDEVTAGRRTIEEAAAEVGRAISPEHFGVSIGYGRGPMSDHRRAQLAARSAGKPIDELVPSSLEALGSLIERYVGAGASKFVVRPIDAPSEWRRELEELADAVGGLQT
jgi:probable F420-dependent oxidoreductase